MLQLARKVFDDSIIARPWRKPVTRWLASESDALRKKPDHRHGRLLRAHRERPRGRGFSERHKNILARFGSFKNDSLAAQAD
jgi:hypothetical protein